MTDKNFKEAKEYIENISEEEVKEYSKDINSEYTDLVILTGVVATSTLSTRVILSNLTGLELEDNENLFNYLKLNLKLSEEERIKLVMTLMLDVVKRS